LLEKLLFDIKKIIIIVFDQQSYALKIIIKLLFYFTKKATTNTTKILRYNNVCSKQSSIKLVTLLKLFKIIKYNSRKNKL